MQATSVQQDSSSFEGKLPLVWNCVLSKYIIDKIQGEGTFGQVVKAYSRNANNKPVAIKYIKNAFESQESCKRVYREIAILRQLTKM